MSFIWLAKLLQVLGFSSFSQLVISFIQDLFFDAIKTPFPKIYQKRKEMKNHIFEKNRFQKVKFGNKKIFRVNKLIKEISEATILEVVKKADNTGRVIEGQKIVISKEEFEVSLGVVMNKIVPYNHRKEKNAKYCETLKKDIIDYFSYAVGDFFVLDFDSLPLEHKLKWEKKGIENDREKELAFKNGCVSRNNFAFTEDINTYQARNYQLPFYDLCDSYYKRKVYADYYLEASVIHPNNIKNFFVALKDGATYKPIDYQTVMKDYSTLDTSSRFLDEVKTLVEFYVYHRHSDQKDYLCFAVRDASLISYRGKKDVKAIEMMHTAGNKLTTSYSYDSKTNSLTLDDITNNDRADDLRQNSEFLATHNLVLVARLEDNKKDNMLAQMEGVIRITYEDNSQVAIPFVTRYNYRMKINYQIKDIIGSKSALVTFVDKGIKKSVIQRIKINGNLAKGYRNVVNNIRKEDVLWKDTIEIGFSDDSFDLNRFYALNDITDQKEPTPLVLNSKKPMEINVFFIGVRQSGKSTFISRFLDLELVSGRGNTDDTRYVDLANNDIIKMFEKQFKLAKNDKDYHLNLFAEVTSNPALCSRYYFHRVLPNTSPKKAYEKIFVLEGKNKNGDTGLVINFFDIAGEIFDDSANDRLKIFVNHRLKWDNTELKEQMEKTKNVSFVLMAENDNTDVVRNCKSFIQEVIKIKKAQKEKVPVAIIRSRFDRYKDNLDIVNNKYSLITTDYTGSVIDKASNNILIDQDNSIAKNTYADFKDCAKVFNCFSIENRFSYLYKDKSKNEVVSYIYAKTMPFRIDLPIYWITKCFQNKENRK